MNSISNTDLDSIFQNTSTKKKNPKELPNFNNISDSYQGTLNRSNPQSLHRNLLDSLIDYPKGNPSKDKSTNSNTNRNHKASRTNNDKFISCQEVKSKPNIFEKIVTNIDTNISLF